MSSTNKTVIAFDLYGTLLSTESIAKELATHFGDDKAQKLAALWRRYQLEYTWRMNSMSMLLLILIICPLTNLQISTNHSAT
jgi:2-haloacid dehalogenase